MTPIITTQEPFVESLVTGEHASSQSEQSPSQPLGEAPEHTMLGDSVTLSFGTGRPVSARSTPLRLARKLEPTYGQIMALAGDFFGDYEKPISDGATLAERATLFEGAFRTLFYWHLVDPWPYQAELVLGIMADETKAVTAALAAGKQPSSAYSTLDLTARYLWATQGRYLLLSAWNWDHFGQHGVLAYQAGHHAALVQAVKAREIGNAEERRRALELAYAMNAFADHFLSDLCSTGHLRTPRKELWEQVAAPGVGTLLAWWMHDEDSRWGLALENKNGHKWKGYGDKRIADSYNVKGRIIAEMMVQTSADEVYEAFLTGERPQPDEFQALAGVADLAAAQNPGDRRHHSPMFVWDRQALKLKRRTSLNDLGDYTWTDRWDGLSTLAELQRSYKPAPPPSHVAPPTGRPRIDPDGWQSRTPVPPRWKNGARLRYAVSFVRALDESDLGPWTDRIVLKDQFFPTLKEIPVDATGRATARRIFRQFNDDLFELVGEIPDNTTTTFVDRTEQRSEAELAVANAVSVVPVIDTSYSMTSSGYVEATVIDGKAFLSKALPEDRIAVASFDTAGTVHYPASGLQQVDESLTVVRAAIKSIGGLDFTGGNTNMGGGIQAARGRLDGAASPRAIVLLSDGYHNHGTDPLTVLPSDYPIHTCAMGPYSDQGLLKEIASRTKGQYHYMPRPIDLMKILNNIRGTAPRTEVAHNALYPVERMGFELVDVPIGEGNHTVHFGVVWESRKYTYADRPGQFRLSVTLVDPQGNTRPDRPLLVEPGYALFALKNPEPGTWKVQIEYGGPKETMHTTVSAFEYWADGLSMPELELELPDEIQAGQHLPIALRAFTRNDAVRDLSARITVARPEISLANALQRYSDELAAVRLEARDLECGGVPADLARLFALRRSRLPEVDILPTVREPLLVVRPGSGQVVAELADTAQAGSYALEIQASGTCPVSGAPFTRARMVSVLVR